MVLDWAAAMRADRDALMIAESEAEVTELNRLAAEHMAKAARRPGGGQGRNGQAQRRQPGPGRRLIQARLNDRLITAAGRSLANRDILQITRIYWPRPRPADPSAAARCPTTWTAKFTLPRRYAEKSATLGCASTIYAAQGRAIDTASPWSPPA